MSLTEFIAASSVHFAPLKVKANCTAQKSSVALMREPFQRLKAAREGAKFGDATQAARRFGWNENTYRSHENGSRDLSRKAAEKYAKAFKVTPGFLLFGRTDEPPPVKARVVQIVGRVGAGARAQYHPEGAQGSQAEVSAPELGEDAVAVEIVGESLGPFFDGWLVFYDDRRDPPTKDFHNRMCVIGLADGRVLLKQLKQSPRRQRWNLHSQFDPPIYDVVVEWAAPVRLLAPP